MNSPVICAVDDKDLDDAALWAVIDSAAAASLSSATNTSKHRKFLSVKHSPIVTSPVPVSNPYPQPKLPKTPKNHRHYTDGEVLQEPWISDDHRPQKLARSSNPFVSELSETTSRPLAVVRHVQRTSPAYSSPEITKTFTSEYKSGGIHNSPNGSECSPVTTTSEERECLTRHGLSGRFPSVSLFKEYQNAAVAILEKSDYTMISGNPFIKKSGWRKISCYFNISYEIKDKTIEFDESRNVQRAEFVVRAYMQGGRFSDGWGSCDRREKRFVKPNHDIPSTAETRAKK